MMTLHLAVRSFLLRIALDGVNSKHRAKVAAMPLSTHNYENGNDLREVPGISTPRARRK
jgi:hypothetical protein